MVTVATERPTLPVPVLEQPHWRVNFRPDEYDPELIPSPSECFRLVEQTSVRFRGWPYPYLSYQSDERRVRANGVASWTDSEYATEYWRLYQSGQFLHLFTFSENNPRHQPQQRLLRRIYGQQTPGYVDFLGLLYTVTEIFEFATRLCLQELYRGSLKITIELKDIEGFRLWVPEPARQEPYEWVSHEPELGKSWSFPSAELIANGADYALDATIWFYERFGWEDPSKDALRRDQREFLSWRDGSR